MKGLDKNKRTSTRSDVICVDSGFYVRRRSLGDTDGFQVFDERIVGLYVGRE